MKIKFRERLDDLIDGDADFEERLMLIIEKYLSDKFTIEEDNAFPFNDFVFDIKIEVKAWDHDSSPYNKNRV